MTSGEYQQHIKKIKLKEQKMKKKSLYKRMYGPYLKKKGGFKIDVKIIQWSLHVMR